MLTLSKIQKSIILIGGVSLVLCCLIPPWVYTFKSESTYSQEPAGYSLIFDPPWKKRDGFAHGVKLDTARILLQIFMISVATGAGVILSYTKLPKSKNHD